MKNYEVIPGKILSRNDLRKVKGGASLAAPDDPSGDAGSRQYKCCWNNTNNCSKCVDCTPQCTCVSGAHLVAC